MILGIDLGSRNVKVALLDSEGFRYYRYDTMEFYRRYGQRVGGSLRIDFPALGLPRAEKVVSTGYGRLTVQVEGGTVIPEIKAHVLGAVHQTGLKDFTLMDLGGQDTKIAKVANGRLIDFLTNDKCAASSGRYLENMAIVLEMPLEELGKHSDDPVELSSTCAVFGESELIGQIIEGLPMERLAAGVNQTIVRRVKPMLRQLLSKTVVFTGGVAFNQAIKEIVEEEMNVKVIVPPEPQLNGAIGCCIFGMDVK
ncbi:MAG: acyl-CoA dehydratase activase [Desulfitobacteriaceae bacterium]|nr:acyl-CoA dehydratase activase [Desulfitobacteriaceae bacterium]